MKATGIVRRIDDLGRIVIPKEIRRTLHIRESDPLEIYTDREGQIILKKYSPIGEMTTFAKQYAESLAQITGMAAFITDRDQVVAVSGAKRDILQKPISKALEQMMMNRENSVATVEEKKFVSVTSEDGDEFASQAVQVILAHGDVIGAVVLMSKDKRLKVGETEQKLAAVAAGFLGRQMEH